MCFLCLPLAQQQQSANKKRAANKRAPNKTAPNKHSEKRAATEQSGAHPNNTHTKNKSRAKAGAAQQVRLAACTETYFSGQLLKYFEIL